MNPYLSHTPISHHSVVHSLQHLKYTIYASLITRQLLPFQRIYSLSFHLLVSLEIANSHFHPLLNRELIQFLLYLELLNCDISLLWFLSLQIHYQQKLAYKFVTRFSPSK